jgi:hypothetical protein
MSRPAKSVKIVEEAASAPAQNEELTTGAFEQVFLTVMLPHYEATKDAADVAKAKYLERAPVVDRARYYDLLYDDEPKERVKIVVPLLEAVSTEVSHLKGLMVLAATCKAFRGMFKEILDKKKIREPLVWAMQITFKYVCVCVCVCVCFGKLVVARCVTGVIRTLAYARTHTHTHTHTHHSEGETVGWGRTGRVKRTVHTYTCTKGFACAKCFSANDCDVTSTRVMELPDNIGIPIFGRRPRLQRCNHFYVLARKIADFEYESVK